MMATKTAHCLTVHSFGEFRFMINGEPVTRWQAGKARHLLQFLLLRKGRIVPKGTLYEAIWPESSVVHARNSLKVAVHALRSILSMATQSDAGADKGSSLRLLTKESGYLLESSDVWVDYELFAEVINEANAAYVRGDHRQASEHYGVAVRLYHGDYLPTTALAWADVQREWLRGQVLTALERLTQFALQAGDQATVINRCRQILEIDPLREEAYRALILVHAQLGQLAQVRRWHQICVSRLKEQLQVTPDAATEHLYLQAMRRDLAGVDFDRRFSEALSRYETSGGRTDSGTRAGTARSHNSFVTGLT